MAVNIVEKIFSEQACLSEFNKIVNDINKFNNFLSVKHDLNKKEEYEESNVVLDLDKPNENDEENYDDIVFWEF